MIFVFGSRYDCFQEPVWVVKGILTARGLVRGMEDESYSKRLGGRGVGGMDAEDGTQDLGILIRVG